MNKHSESVHPGEGDNNTQILTDEVKQPNSTSLRSLSGLLGPLSESNITFRTLVSIRDEITRIDPTVFARVSEADFCVIVAASQKTLADFALGGSNEASPSVMESVSRTLKNVARTCEMMHPISASSPVRLQNPTSVVSNEDNNNKEETSKRSRSRHRKSKPVAATSHPQQSRTGSKTPSVDRDGSAKKPPVAPSEVRRQRFIRSITNAVSSMKNRSKVNPISSTLTEPPGDLATFLADTAIITDDIIDKCYAGAKVDETGYCSPLLYHLVAILEDELRNSDLLNVAAVRFAYQWLTSWGTSVEVEDWEDSIRVRMQTRCVHLLESFTEIPLEGSLSCEIPVQGGLYHLTRENGTNLRRSVRQTLVEDIGDSLWSRLPVEAANSIAELRNEVRIDSTPQSRAQGLWRFSARTKKREFRVSGVVQLGDIDGKKFLLTVVTGKEACQLRHKYTPSRFSWEVDAVPLDKQSLPRGSTAELPNSSSEPNPTSKPTSQSTKGVTFSQAVKGATVSKTANPIRRAEVARPSEGVIPKSTRTGPKPGNGSKIPTQTLSLDSPVNSANSKPKVAKGKQGSTASRPASPKEGSNKKPRAGKIGDNRPSGSPHRGRQKSTFAGRQPDRMMNVPDPSVMQSAIAKAVSEQMDPMRKLLEEVLQGQRATVRSSPIDGGSSTASKSTEKP